MTPGFVWVALNLKCVHTTHSFFFEFWHTDFKLCAMVTKLGVCVGGNGGEKSKSSVKVYVKKIKIKESCSVSNFSLFLFFINETKDTRYVFQE